MQNIFANTKQVHIKQWHIDLFSQALFAGNILLKLKRKCSRNRPKTSLKCSRIIFSQIWQTLQQILLSEKSSSFADLLAKHNYMRKSYSIQEVFRRIFMVFLHSWMFCDLVRCLQIFCANYFAKNIFVAKIFLYMNLACFVLLAF